LLRTSLFYDDEMAILSANRKMGEPEERFGLDDELSFVQELVQEDTTGDEAPSWAESVRATVSNKNFTIFLLTSWIYSSVQVVNRYFPIYLRDISVTYVFVGALSAVLAGVSLLGEFTSGYLADNYDRRKLAALTMAINAVAYFILASTRDVWLVAVAFIVFGLGSFPGKGGTAYILEQIDRRHGGVAVSLFTLGTVFGLVPLYVVGVLLNLGIIFEEVMRTMFFFSAIAYAVCSVIRIVWLDSTTSHVRAKAEGGILRDFLSENVRGIRLLFRVFPVFIGIMCLDALSDTFYGFANLYYVNETLAFGIGDINLMLLLTLTISIPLTLILGRMFDKYGGRRLTIAVYSVMPVAIGLLVVAQTVEYIAPQALLDAADAVYPGLSVIFSLAFIATAIKSINDVLWFTVIDTYIQKSLPRQDLGKMLSLSAVFILACVTVGNIPAGFIYQTMQGIPLLFLALGLNFVILVILATKTIEPKVSVEELEAELSRDTAL
jgi:MFS family permease